MRYVTMKVPVKIDPTLDAGGSSLQGYLQATYAHLVSVLGAPGPGDGYKTDAEWVMKCDKVLATIYNWKNGRAYRGPSAPAIEQITEWHVGGNSAEALKVIQQLTGCPVVDRTGAGR